MSLTPPPTPKPQGMRRGLDKTDDIEKSPHARSPRQKKLCTADNYFQGNNNADKNNNTYAGDDTITSGNNSHADDASLTSFHSDVIINSNNIQPFAHTNQNSKESESLVSKGVAHEAKKSAESKEASKLLKEATAQHEQKELDDQDSIHSNRFVHEVTNKVLDKSFGDVHGLNQKICKFMKFIY